jgi:hypothetical protein
MALNLPLSSRISTAPENLVSLLKGRRVQPIVSSVNVLTESNKILQSVLGTFTMPEDGSIGEGGRNTFLTSAGGWLRRNVQDEYALAILLHTINVAKCDPPLERTEVDQIAKSVSRYSIQTSLKKSKLSLNSGKVSLSSVPPAVRKTLWGDMIHEGKYSVLAGPGGVSKTMLTIGLAVQVAIGQKWADQQVAKGASLLVLGEEDSDEVNRRVNAVVKNFSAADQTQVQHVIRAIPASGLDIRLVQLQNGNPVPTGLDDHIVEMVNQLQEESKVPVRLVALDHARLVGAGDTNDASHVTELTRVLTSIACRTQAAVVLLAHSPKGTLGKTDEELSAADVAGSSAYVDNARSVLLMTTLSDREGKSFGLLPAARTNYARLQVVKNNYGRTGTKLYFERVSDPDFQVSQLVPVQLTSVNKKGCGQTSLEKSIIEIVSTLPVPIGKTRFRDTYSGKSRQLKASESEVRHALERMLMDGRLLERIPNQDERKLWRLSANVKTVLTPGAGLRDDLFKELDIRQ